MTMTSRERLLAALDHQPADHIPLLLRFWSLGGGVDNIPFNWRDQVERVRGMLALGLDDTLLLQPPLGYVEDYIAECAPGVRSRVEWLPQGESDRYPLLKKVSVDYAVMEPASRDSSVRVAALPMPLEWLDVGSWATFAKTCPSDAQGNALGAARHVLEQTSNTLVVSSDPKHVVATIGCEGLTIIHTPDATLVCRSDKAEAVKALRDKVAQQFGQEYV